MVAATPVSIDQRFAQLIQQFGLTKNSFAISLGKTASVIQHLIDGRNKPGYDLLCKVFEIYPNVSRDWLLLGKGPMLVSGEPASKAPLPAPRVAPEPPLEPIDISDLEVHAPRRNGAGAARLQPNEIAATLALAAVASQPARTATAAPQFTPSQAPGAEVPGVEKPEIRAEAAAATPPLAPVLEAQVPHPAAADAHETVATAQAPPANQVGGAENYVAAALHAQHLQHQLAMAELRNQHLLEQQQMLREMLAMARQAMV